MPVAKDKRSVSRSRQSRFALIGRSSAILACLAMGLASAGHAQDRIVREPGSIDPALVPPYVVRPGDVLSVFVWKEPDLSGSVAVRLDGKITLPLVGELVAEGQTPEQLRVELTQRLSRFVEAPQITVSVAQATSARFFVIGQTKSSGVFPLDGRLTVLQAIALAGGFSTFAKRDRVIVIREDQSVLQFDFKKIEEGRNLWTNTVLQPGDTIVVP